MTAKNRHIAWQRWYWPLNSPSSWRSSCWKSSNPGFTFKWLPSTIIRKPGDMHRTSPEQVQKAQIEQRGPIVAVRLNYGSICVEECIQNVLRGISKLPRHQLDITNSLQSLRRILNSYVIGTAVGTLFTGLKGWVGCVAKWAKVVCSHWECFYCWPLLDACGAVALEAPVSHQSQISVKNQ